MAIYALASLYLDLLLLLPEVVNLEHCPENQDTLR